MYFKDLHSRNFPLHPQKGSFNLWENICNLQNPKSFYNNQEPAPSPLHPWKIKILNPTSLEVDGSDDFLVQFFRGRAITTTTGATTQNRRFQ